MADPHLYIPTSTTEGGPRPYYPSGLSSLDAITLGGRTGADTTDTTYSLSWRGQTLQWRGQTTEWRTTVIDRAPNARAGVDQSVAAGAAVTLNGAGSTDPEDAVLTYAWSQTVGDTVALSDDAVANPTFTAPSTNAEQTLTFELTVTDPAGNDDTDTVAITVAATINLAPNARAGADQSVAAASAVTLSGSTSTDPENAVLTYAWSQTSGDTVALSDDAVANPTFTAPSTSAEQTLTFELTVTDPAGNDDTDTVDITVAAVVDLAPTARAGVDRSVVAGSTVTLSGSTSTDPEGETLDYAWTQTVGDTVALSDATAANPTFTAPSTSAEQTLTFRLTVTDPGGQDDTDTVDITVAAVATTPVLMLDEFDTTGLDVEFAALLQRTESGDILYRAPGRGGTDAPLDGDLLIDGSIGSSNISRIRWLSNDTLLINEQNDPGDLTPSVYFGANGLGIDLTIYLITEIGGTVYSHPVAGNTAALGGGFANFVNFPVAMETAFEAIDTGDRWIFAMARPA